MKRILPVTVVSVDSSLHQALALFRRKVRTALRVAAWRLFQQSRVAIKRAELFWREVRLRLFSVKTEFRLWGWYGRTGKNVQQLIVAIAHAEAFGGCTGMDDQLLKRSPLDGIIRAFSTDFAPDREVLEVYSTIFFHYTEYTFRRSDVRRLAFRRGHSPRRECILGRRYIEANAHRIAQQYLVPLLAFPPDPLIEDGGFSDGLVIHLRSGDVGGLDNPYYITNPLCFYRNIASRYRHATLVTEPGVEHPLLPAIASLFREIAVVSGAACDDFKMLCNATHLASSGVGTFVMAAALLSRNLRVFHCTDLFQVEHLNPRMFDSDRVDVNMQVMKGFQRQWLRSPDRLGLLMAFEPGSG